MCFVSDCNEIYIVISSKSYDLMKNTQLISFFKWIGKSGCETKYFQGNGKPGFKGIMFQYFNYSSYWMDRAGVLPKILFKPNADEILNFSFKASLKPKVYCEIVGFIPALTSSVLMG